MPLPFRAAALALLTALAPLAQPAAAFDPANLTDAERGALRAEFRAWLLENPEVLVEAIGVLEERQAAVQTTDDATLVAVNAAALFDNPHAWVGGNPDGDVTLVEFLDYNCGFCRRAWPEVTELLDFDPGVRLVLIELPILGPDSDLAARFAISVLQTAGPEVYAEAHDRMMRMNGRVGAPVLARIAAEMGLDMEALTARMQGPEVNTVIEENRALAQRLGIAGTPSFVLGDRLLRGYLPLADMLDIVEDVREGS
jgi:protein-disulfide isomerase